MIRRPQSAPLFPYTTLFRSQWLSGYATDNLHIAGSSMGGAIASVMAHTLDRPPRTVTLLNSASIPEQPDADLNAPFKTDRDAILIPRDWSGVYRMFNSVGNGKPTLPGLAITGLLGPDLMQRRDSLRHIFNDMLADPLAPARYL